MEQPKTSEETRERDKKAILYKKATRTLLPKNALFGAGCFQTLNELTRKTIQDTLKIAYNEAKKQNRTTIRPSDIRTAHQELGKLNSSEFVDKFETAINSRIKEIKLIEQQKKEVVLNG